MDEFYTVHNLSKALKVSEATVRRKLEGGKIGGHKVGSQWRVSKAQFETYLDASCNSGPGGYFVGTEERGAINLGPQKRPVNPMDGDVYFDVDDRMFYGYGLVGWYCLGMCGEKDLKRSACHDV